MKQVAECFNCQKIIPLSLSYQVQQLVNTTHPLTGEVGQERMGGFVCAICNKLMGYKTSQKKLNKLYATQNKPQRAD